MKVQEIIPAVLIFVRYCLMVQSVNADFLKDEPVGNLNNLRFAWEEYQEISLYY